MLRELQTGLATERRLTEQYQAQQQHAIEIAEKERQDRASALEHKDQRAKDAETAERDKNMQLVMDTINKEMDSNYRNLLQHIQSNQTQFEQAVTSTRDALAKAERVTDDRFESANNFRGTIMDYAERLLPRETFETSRQETDRRIEQYATQINRNSTNIAEMQARMGGNQENSDDNRQNLAIGISVGSVLISIIFQIVTNLIKGGGA